MDDRENVFESAENALRYNWEVHRQAFGPILEPAFVENPQVRVSLIAALNHISRREIKQGMKILKQIRKYCIYDEDKAAWTFFVGVGFEMAGAREEMLKWYAEAGTYNHRFYLPYLKLAKAAHNDGRYQEAREYYETAIECLLEMSENDKDEVILGAAYTNLTACLTLMYCYRDAASAWKKAEQYPLPPGAESVAAILFAAMKDPEKTAYYTEMVREKCPMFLKHTQDTTRQILDGTHPHFVGR